MSVVAKFTVDEIRRIKSSVPMTDENGQPVRDENTKYVLFRQGEIQSVILRPVSSNGDPNHENNKFWAASPQGQIEIGCANLGAAQYFELGKEYLVTFQRAVEDVEV